MIISNIVKTIIIVLILDIIVMTLLFIWCQSDNRKLCNRVEQQEKLISKYIKRLDEKDIEIEENYKKIFNLECELKELSCSRHNSFKCQACGYEFQSTINRPCPFCGKQDVIIK